MKVSVSIPDDLLEFLDGWAALRGVSRSAAMSDAIAAVRAVELGDAYAEAWAEDDGAWDATVADGLT